MEDQNSDDDTRRASGIEATVGDDDMPKVSGVDPKLAEKDPGDVTLEDLQGLDDDERAEVMDFMSSTDGEQSDPPSNAVGGDDPDDGSDDDGAETEQTSDTDDEPDPATLDETGLLNENDEFPWEGESLGETEVGEGGIIEQFEYKGTGFEVREPEDRQRFERHFDSLAGAQDIDDRAKRRSTADRYSQKVAEQCLTVESHPIDAVYRVTHNGTHHVVPDSDGSKGLDTHPDAEPLWDAMTWFDRFKLGMRLGEDVLGERQFQSRVS